MRGTTRGALVALIVSLVVSSTLAGAQTTPSTTAPTSTPQSDSTETTERAEDPEDGRYRGFGDGGGFLNVLPPGQNAGVTEEMFGRISAALEGEGEFPAHYTDQLELYESLVYAEELTDEELGQYFKDASFGVAPDDIGRVYRPHDDVVVIRDASYGVPHVFGLTRYSTMYAQGYTTAEDRMFFMDVLRHVGRGRLAELIGYSEDFIDRDRSTVGTSPYREEDLTAQIDELANSGPEGASIVADVTAYADGVNAFMTEFAQHPELEPIEYKLLGITPDRWVPEDAVAIATLVGAIFGRGGGREVENACGIARMAKTLGDDEARTVFDDLHFIDGDGSPVTSSDAVDYDLARPAAVEPDAHPRIDCASLTPLNGASPSTEDLTRGFASSRSILDTDPAWDRTAGLLDSLAAAVRYGPHLSNALLVAGERTANGRPIAVFGPQIGYSAPELLTEKDVHGPGIDARGVGFLGVDFYVLLGRGNRYAWSATSSGADNVDQVVLERCSTTGLERPGRFDGYRKGDACVAFETWDHTLDAPKTALPGTKATVVTWRIERSEYGPVLWYANTVDGTPIAIVERRSTYGREVTSAVGFKQLNDPEFMSGGVDRFREAVGTGIDYTFNWFYVDDRDIAMQDSCRCPVRASGIDPSLPAVAGGKFDWTGEFLTVDQLPHDVDPESGYLVNWNNRPAPGWDSADDQFAYGPIHRSLALSTPLADRLAADVAENGSITPTVTQSDVVAVMRDGATRDLVGTLVLPRLLEAMGTPPESVDPALLDLRERLEIWADDGAFRRDANNDGELDEAVAPAILDAWWPRIIESVFADDGDPFTSLDIYVASLGDSSPASSAIIAVLDGTTDHEFCKLEGCKDELWSSLARARDDLAEEFGGDDPTEWVRTVADDEIHYSTLLAGMPTMHWQNRPTFQQVVQLETELDRPEPTPDTTVAPNSRGANDSDENGGLAIAVGALALGAIAFGAWWRQRRRRR